MRLAFLLFLSAFAFGQTFPMRYLADRSHFEGKKVIDLGVARAREEPDGVRIEGRDRAGKPWLVRMGVAGGIGATEVWSADFDGDGQRDLLMGSHFPANGWCPNGVEVTLLLFEANGRPMPWVASSYIPDREVSSPYALVQVRDANRDGRAEFVLTACDAYKDQRRTTGIYEAKAGRLIATKWPDLMPGLDSKAAERLEELTGGGFGYRTMQPPPPPAKPSRYAWVDTRSKDPCAGTAEAETRLSGHRVTGWADNVVLDGPEGREVYIGKAGSWTGLQRALRYGYTVKWIDPGNEAARWLWADAWQPVDPAQVVVELQVFASRRIPAHVLPTEGNCYDILYPTATLRRCPDSGLWSRTWESSREELLPNGRTVRAAHTAMQHTVTGETRFERPPGGRTLRGKADLPDGMMLTQWTDPTGPLFALHGDNGRLIASRVLVPFHGDLVTGSDALVFSERTTGTPKYLTEVRGRLRWRRVQ